MSKYYFVHLDSFDAGKLLSILDGMVFPNAGDMFFYRHLRNVIVDSFASQMDEDDFPLWYRFSHVDYDD